MTNLLLALILVLLVREAMLQLRLRRIESRLSYVIVSVLSLQSDEHLELRLGIIEQRKLLHDMVLKARATGNLDRANKMMELQRWADVDYEAEWLDGMFRGFP